MEQNTTVELVHEEPVATLNAGDDIAYDALTQTEDSFIQDETDIGAEGLDEAAQECPSVH